MKPFLKYLAEYILENFGEKKLEKLCFIFPNRRSGVFFKHYLMQVGRGYYWMPEIYTISDFVVKYSGLEIADPIDVSFELYQIYCSLVPSPEIYDEFYYWGEMMIRDFEDVDKYMVPAEKLFVNIKDLKALDNFMGGFDEEQIKIIREFWKHFNKSQPSDEQLVFMNNWNNLSPLYNRLREKLGEQQTGYEGMLYRKLAESVQSGDFNTFPWENIIIAGFNALNTAENVIFRHLRNTGKALFFWDYDHAYVDNKFHEAGRFLRKNLEEFPPVEMNRTFHNLDVNKNLKVYELPSDVLQARQMGRILTGNRSALTTDFDNTAVILGDENLLEPVLSSIPEFIPHVNITMGYPLSHTSAFSFINHLLRLQRNISHQSGGQKHRLYYRDVLPILNHQYLMNIMNNDLKRKLKEIQELNLIYIDPDFFYHNELLRKIFRNTGSVDKISSYLREVLEQVISLYHSADNPGNEYNLEKEYAYFIISRLNKLEKIFNKDMDGLTTDTYTRLFTKIMYPARIPFEGEPLRGLQVMGILESRLLDFKNIIFLSLNEGVMPGAYNLFTFIPVNLRRAFNMPVREDHDAIYAYYFYRLLQRAENVFILYNSKSDGMRSGEKSRYLYQLDYLSAFNPEYKTLAFNISHPAAKVISIEKTSEILKKLERFLENGDRTLSPTAITSWLDCRLRFYFTYIAGLREQDEITENIDAPLLGNILHHAMKFIYEDHSGKELNSDIFQLLSAETNIVPCINRAFNKEFGRDSNKNVSDYNPEGRNIIVYEVIKKLVKNILWFDEKQLPFILLETENNHERIITAGAIRIRLGGVIDRVDLRKGIIHIIDYKTGKANPEFISIGTLFDPGIKERRKEILQTLIYAYLYENSLSGNKDIIPCIYSTRRIHKEDFIPYLSLKNSAGSRTSSLITFNQYREEFLQRLVSAIKDIFDPLLAFTQTDEKKHCTNCPYIKICHRDQ